MCPSGFSPPLPLLAQRSAIASSFQIIEGRISRTASGREFVYLNFGRNTRADFSVTIRQSDRALLGDLGGDLKTLEGHTVEVRGWIEHRAGPTIDLSMAGQIVVLGSELTDASETGTAVRPGTPRRRGADKQKRPVLEGTGR